ncbi:MAG: KEOPS complex subunit Cgi121 [Candidatus Methanofastidiosia archaeon]
MVVVGAKLEVRAVEKLLENAKDCVLFDPTYVCCIEHALFACRLAQNSIERGENVAKDFRMEFLVRLSGERQIKKALNFGIREGLKVVGILIFHERIDEVLRRFGALRNDSVFELNQEKIQKIKRHFGIEGETKDELLKAIFERGAILSVQG